MNVTSVYFSTSSSMDVQGTPFHHQQCECAGRIPVLCLKVPKCEIFDNSDFDDFYTIKSLWGATFGLK
jgi:hypothetical protein